MTVAVCFVCGRAEELRGGCCFDCASNGERRAAGRTVPQHLAKAAQNILAGHFYQAKFDLAWAWERLTSTGDYTPGGYFDQEYPGFRL